MPIYAWIVELFVRQDLNETVMHIWQENGLKTNCGTQTLLIKSESITYLIDGDDDDCDAIMQ